MRVWADKTEIAVGRFLPWIGIGTSKFHDWKSRFGKVNEHNAWVPRDHWLTDAEKEGIRGFARQHPLEGYRRLTFMMLDADVVACSPASVYRVLKAAGLLAGQTPTPTKKGTGFVQPLRPHEHWHVDVSYLNIAGTFYFLCSILDGCSRFIVHWEIREKMEEIDVETIIQRAREAYPDARPRIISDNGPQFIAKDFKEFIRVCGMTHVKTSPYYPQSNGKIERWHKTLKGDCIRVLTPLSLDDARRIVADYVTHYNTVRLHSAIGYITPQDKLAGREAEIFAARDRKLAEARQRRQQQRQATGNQAPGSAGLTPCHRLRRPPRRGHDGGRPATARLPFRSSHGVQQFLHPLLDLAGLPVEGEPRHISRRDVQQFLHPPLDLAGLPVEGEPRHSSSSRLHIRIAVLQAYRADRAVPDREPLDGCPLVSGSIRR